MKNFRLDPRLEKDCFRLGVLGNGLLLLMNNAQLPWFVLVPETDVCEFHELNEVEQSDVLVSINQISSFIKDEYSVDKINVAAIGNIVSQLHIHIVGRRKNDYCWPGVVWGAPGATAYEDSEVERIRQLTGRKLDDRYRAASAALDQLS